MGVKPSRPFLKDKRWPVLRIQALRRDDWRCVQCGSRFRLEVDHIKATRHRPDLAFTLENLQVLCARCHTKKTCNDIGITIDPEREKWRDLLR